MQVVLLLHIGKEVINLRYAVIQNNTVVNIIEADEEAISSIPATMDTEELESYVECQDNVKIGDSYTNNEFIIQKTIEEQLEELKMNYEKLNIAFEEKISYLENNISELQDVLAEILLNGGENNENSIS